jgi:hypothetical protein
MSKITIDIDDEMLAALLIHADENDVSLDDHILSKLTANISTDILTEEIEEEALEVQDIVEQQARDAREGLETWEPEEEPPCVGCDGDVVRGQEGDVPVRNEPNGDPGVTLGASELPNMPPSAELEPDSPFNRPPVPKKHVPKGVPFHNKRVIGKWL